LKTLDIWIIYFIVIDTFHDSTNSVWLMEQSKMSSTTSLQFSSIDILDASISPNQIIDKTFCAGRDSSNHIVFALINWLLPLWIHMPTLYQLISMKIVGSTLHFRPTVGIKFSWIDVFENWWDFLLGKKKL
jgi:hypothetical protein